MISLTSTKHKRHSNSIIRIHVMKSESLGTCTCGGLYCSAQPLPMDFILPHTRLIHDHLRSFIILPYTRNSCYFYHMNHFTIYKFEWSLKCQDVTLLESINYFIHYITTKRITPWNSLIFHILFQNQSYLITTLLVFKWLKSQEGGVELAS